MPKAAAREGGDSEEFSSKFSFVFQQCVCLEEARMMREGRSDIDSLREAFRLCNEKVQADCPPLRADCTCPVLPLLPATQLLVPDDEAERTTTK